MKQPSFKTDLEIHEAFDNIQNFGHFSVKKWFQRKTSFWFWPWSFEWKKLVSNKNNCTNLEIHEALEDVQNFRHLSEKQNPVTAFLQGVQKPPQNLK